MPSRLIAFLLLVSANVFAQEVQTAPVVIASGLYGFDHYSTEEGLAGNTIDDIFQDSKGYIWIASRGGVSRLDGKTIVNYTDKDGLVHNHAHAVREDKKGIIWIATDKGLSSFNGATFTNYVVENDSRRTQSWCLAEHPEGGMLVGTSAGVDLIHNGQRESFILLDTIPGEKAMVRSLNYDSKGNLWVGSQRNFFRFDQQLNKEKIADLYVGLGWAEDADGKIWFGSWSNFLGCYENGKYIQYDIGTPINDICIDKNGTMWLATWDLGIIKFDGNLSFKSFGEKQGVGIPSVWSVMADYEGNIWAGTYGVGAAVLTDEKFALFNEFNGLAHPLVSACVQDSLDNFWLATSGGVTCLKPDGTSFHFTEADGLDNLRVQDIMISKNGHIWFILYGGSEGVIEFDGTQLIKHQVGSGFSLREMSDGSFWYGSDGGGVVVVKNGVRIKSIRSNDSHERVLNSFEDSKNQIWLGRERYAYMVYKNDTLYHNLFSPYHSSSHGSVICEDQQGYIWITLSKKGLYRCSFEKDTVLLLDSLQLSDGLLDEEISGLTCTGNTLWINSRKGLSKFNLSSYYLDGKSEWKHYTKADGFVGEGSCDPKVTSEGLVYFGTSKGLMILDESVDRVITTPPNTVINSVKLFQQEINWTERDYTLLPGENFPTEITLPYNENHLSFLINGISFYDHNEVTYKYILEGFDADWSIPTRRDEIVYSNIPPGNYIFKVAAANKDGFQDETPAEIKITITPPFWQTIAFRILMILLIAGSLYFFYRLKNKKLIRDKKILEEQVKLRTAQLDSAFHEIKQKKEEITDSISYAKRIQSAILPSQKLVDKTLGENFIFYQPKDIVAGDFYWISEKNGYTLAAVADCTGHGVPGAMVSVVCHAALNRAIREFNLTKPSEILNTVREIVIETFSKSEEEVKDGMDIALISIKKENQQTILEFSGANNPLWIFRPGKFQDIDKEKNQGNNFSVRYVEDFDLTLIELHPDKQPVGKFIKETPFTNQQFLLQKQDLIYLFSDGFADQFGGEKGKKMKNVGFKNVLLENNDCDMINQKKALTIAFDKWRGDFEQLDDVCVIGVKI